MSLLCIEPEHVAVLREFCILMVMQLMRKFMLVPAGDLQSL